MKENSWKVNVYRGDVSVNHLIDSSKLWSFGQALVKHENADHIGRGVRDSELWVDRRSAGRQLVQARQQLVHFELNGALGAPLSQPEVT